MTRKQFDKRYRKVRNTLIKVLTITMLLLLLLTYFNNNKLIDILIKRNNAQTTQMQQLEQEVRELQVSNARLGINLAHEHTKVQQLSTATPKINYITVKKEEPKQEKVHIADMLLPKQEDVTTVIIGTLATLGGMVKTLVPQF